MASMNDRTELMTNSLFVIPLLLLASYPHHRLFCAWSCPVIVPERRRLLTLRYLSQSTHFGRPRRPHWLFRVLTTGTVLHRVPFSGIRINVQWARSYLWRAL